MLQDQNKPEGMWFERYGSFSAKAVSNASTEHPGASGIEIRFLTIPKDRKDFEVRAEDVEGEPPQLVGYAAVYDVWSEPLGEFYETIRPGAFAGAFEPGADVRGLFNHDPNYVLGRTTSKTLELVDAEQGLRYRIKPPNTDIGQRVVANVRRGDVTGSSFAFLVAEDGDRWWQEDGKVFREILKVELYDVGPVTYPAYEQTSVVSTRTFDRRNQVLAIPVSPVRREHLKCRLGILLDT